MARNYLKAPQQFFLRRDARRPTDNGYGCPLCETGTTDAGPVQRPLSFPKGTGSDPGAVPQPVSGGNALRVAVSQPLPGDAVGLRGRRRVPAVPIQPEKVSAGDGMSVGPVVSPGATARASGTPRFRWQRYDVSALDSERRAVPRGLLKQ